VFETASACANKQGFRLSVLPQPQQQRRTRNLKSCENRSSHECGVSCVPCEREVDSRKANLFVDRRVARPKPFRFEEKPQGEREATLSDLARAQTKKEFRESRALVRGMRLWRLRNNWNNCPETGRLENSTIKSSRFAVSFRGISWLGFAFIFLR